jgi:hypothetical protein
MGSIPGRSRRRRTLVPALTFAVAAALTAGCTLNGPPHGSGDPGNQRLHTLTADRMMHTLPADSQRYRSLYIQPATWDTSYHYWSSPKVTSEFTSRLTYGQVYSFCGNLIAADGWVADARDPSFGLVWSWHKAFPGGFVARMQLQAGKVNSTSDHASLYDLVEVADPIRK